VIERLSSADEFEPGSLGPKSVCQVIEAFAAVELNDNLSIDKHGSEPWYSKSDEAELDVLKKLVITNEIKTKATTERPSPSLLLVSIIES